MPLTLWLGFDVYWRRCVAGRCAMDGIDVVAGVRVTATSVNEDVLRVRLRVTGAR